MFHVTPDAGIFAYVFAPDFGKYLAVQEELLLQILGIVESSGTELALPTQVTHLKSDRNAAPSGEPKEPLAAFGER